MAEKRRIKELGAGEVDLVEGLWKELRVFHEGLRGEDLPPRDLDESWAMRRAQYVGWLESGEGMMFFVPGEGAEGAPLGYACLRIESAGPTWDLGEVVGDLETLSVAPAARGAGVGTELISHCRDRLVELGARWWTVSVLADNGRAAELYEREGFRPHIDYMLAPLR